MKILTQALVGIGLLLGVMTVQSCTSKTQAAPYGGDIVPLNDGKVKAEVVANSETGEVMVHTWGQNLRDSNPIEAKPLVIGSGNQTVELQPHPTAADPPGLCSRFYGQAEWVRGGQARHGWLSRGTDQSRNEFAWNNCWRGGQAHGSMWSEMGEHRRGMMGHGPGAGMGHE
jgi:hypothetical protein